MHESGKDRYITSGINQLIPKELQQILWTAVDKMPEPKDYLQVFKLSTENNMQVVEHESEVPEFHMRYVLTTAEEKITAKVYIIDDGTHCTMLLAEEY